MAETQILAEHKTHVARMQHILEGLASERARLETELRYVLESGQRMQNELVAFLQRAYGIDAARPGVIMDADNGVITEPDEAPTEPEPAAEPATTTTE